MMNNSSGNGSNNNTDGQLQPVWKNSSGAKLPIIILSVVILSGLTLIMLFGGKISGFFAIKKQIAEMQAKAMKPHTEISALIKKLVSSSRELTPCPLIFPLTNVEDSGLTPLGSFISYLAMIRASYTPGFNMSIPDVGYLFQNLALFDPLRKPIQQVYREQLPMRFKGRHFGEGTIKKLNNEYEIALHFWGGKIDGYYRKKFPVGEVHKAPEWAAECYFLWTEAKLEQQQKEYFSKTLFLNEDNFLKSARIEHILRAWPAIACGVDKMSEKEPDNPFLKSRWQWTAADRNQGGSWIAVNKINNTAEKSPFTIYEEIKASISNPIYDAEPAKALINQLLNDNNNVYLYKSAVKILSKSKYNSEAIELAEAWTKIHPENQDAWMLLSDTYINWAWDLRGNGYANTVESKKWAEIERRINFGLNASRRATKTAPGDGWTWNNLMISGLAAGIDKLEMHDAFSTSIGLNPYDSAAYLNFANYLQPKWHGSIAEIEGLYKQFYNKCPFLISEIAQDSFRASGSYEFDGNQIARDNFADAVKSSPYYKDYKNIMLLYFGRKPMDIKNWEDYFFWMSLTGNRDKALADAKKVIPQGNPDLAALYPNLVLAAISQDLNGQATDHAKEKITRNPAVIKMKLKAINDLIKADEHNWEAWNELAKYYVDKKMKKEAIKCFKAIGDNSVYDVWGEGGYKEAKIWLGLAKREKKLPDSAIDQRTGKAKTPLQLLFDKMYSGNYAGAIRDCDLFLKDNPADYTYYNYRATAKIALANNKEALMDLDKAIELNPKYTSAYLTRGNLRITMGDYKGAVKDFEAVIKGFPQACIGYSYRGIAYTQMGDYNAANKDFDTAFYMQPKSDITFKGRGMMYYKKGDYGKAKKDLETALVTMLKDGEVYYYLAEVKLKLGDKAGALKDASKALELGDKRAEKIKNELKDAI